MKHVLKSVLIIILFPITSLHSQGLFTEKKDAKGYLLTVRGDSIAFTFELEKVFSDGDPVLTNYNFKYKDKNGKKIKIKLDDLKEFGYFLNGKLSKYVPVYKVYQIDGTVFRSFSKLEIDDYLMLYSDFSPGFSGPYGPNTGPSILYSLKKPDGGLFNWGAFFRKDLSEYLKEDKELVVKIQNRDLKEKDIVAIVNEYNRWYKYERNAK
jgi:hypothetical protein